MRRRSDSLKAGTAARSQNYRSAIASADSFDRYYRLSDYRYFALSSYCTPGPNQAFWIRLCVP